MTFAFFDSNNLWLLSQKHKPALLSLVPWSTNSSCLGLLTPTVSPALECQLGGCACIPSVPSCIPELWPGSSVLEGSRSTPKGHLLCFPSPVMFTQEKWFRLHLSAIWTFHFICIWSVLGILSVGVPVSRLQIHLQNEDVGCATDIIVCLALSTLLPHIKKALKE